MKRLLLIILTFLSMICCSDEKIPQKETAPEGESVVISPARKYWVELLDKIAFPVMSNLSEGKLKQKMPLEYIWGRAPKTAYLEAFGRTIAGLGPWMELGPDDTEEGQLRANYIDMTIKSLDYATRPGSPDYMNFVAEQQPLVDAAFLAQGLLRCRTQVWDKVPAPVKAQVINRLKATRKIPCPENNWLLFRGMIEAFLLEIGEDAMVNRMDYAVDTHLGRYQGDGVYSDGDHFHWDYYNSFVIQPMLVDITGVLVKHHLRDETVYATVMKRMTRFASVLERLIGPTGAVPPTGRSITYRTGILQTLSQAALIHELDSELSPAQVRCAITASMKAMYEVPGTFENGWLKIGLAGSQISLAEPYINTGSLYLCTTGFLALGLPESDPFWTGADVGWTSLKVWNGEDVEKDRNIR